MQADNTAIAKYIDIPATTMAEDAGKGCVLSFLKDVFPSGFSQQEKVLKQIADYNAAERATNPNLPTLTYVSGFDSNTPAKIAELTTNQAPGLGGVLYSVEMNLTTGRVAAGCNDIDIQAGSGK